MAYATKKNEVMDFLKQQEIDIFLVNETKLTSKMKCKIPGFHSFRKDRPNDSAAGGVAIYCNYNISCSEIDFDTDSVESLGIKLGNNMIIASVYARPQTKIEKHDLDKIFGVANSTIAMGDLNAKHTSWNCSSNNTNGKRLLNYTSSRGINILAPDNFTLFPYTGALPSTVDFALVKNVNNHIDIESIDDLDSDHNPIIINLSNTNVTHQETTTLSYKKADWTKFKNYLDNKPTTDLAILSTEDIDKSVTILTNTIYEAVELAIPKNIIKHQTIALPENIREAIRLRNKYQGSLRTQETQYLEKLKIDYRGLSKKLSKNTPTKNGITH